MRDRKKKWMKKNEQNCRDLEDIFEYTNECIMEAPEDEWEKRQQEHIKS